MMKVFPLLFLPLGGVGGKDDAEKLEQEYVQMMTTNDDDDDDDEHDRQSDDDTTLYSSLSIITILIIIFISQRNKSNTNNSKNNTRITIEAWPAQTDQTQAALLHYYYRTELSTRSNNHEANLPPVNDISRMD